LADKAVGYFALLGPKADGESYFLDAGLIHLPLHDKEGKESVVGLTGAKLLPGPAKDAPDVLAKPPDVNESAADVLGTHVDEAHVRPGEELLLVDKWLRSKGDASWTHIRLWVRFYTPQELDSGAQ
jgi:hypothetical protein